VLLIATFITTSCVPPIDKTGNRLGKKEMELNLANFSNQRKKDSNRNKQNNSTKNNSDQNEDANDDPIAQFEKRVTKSKDNAKSKKDTKSNPMNPNDDLLQRQEDFEYSVNESISNLKGEIIEIKGMLSDIASDKLKPTTGRNNPATTKQNAQIDYIEPIETTASPSSSSTQYFDNDLIENTFIISSEEEAETIKTSLKEQSVKQTPKSTTAKSVEKKSTPKARKDFNIAKTNTPKPAPVATDTEVKSDISVPSVSPTLVDGYVADAKGKIAKGDYSGAISQLEQALQSAKDQNTVANCNYLLGECNFNLRDYARAIPYYKSVLSGKSDKKDSATARIAEAYYRVGKTDEAKLAYQNLLKEFPKSAHSSKAKKMLQQL
jgi:TolA-binding protein